MTPERKARQLFDAYNDHAFDSPLGTEYHTKQMCYICISQITNSLQYHLMIPEDLKRLQDYWDDVRKEVSKIKY